MRQGFNESVVEEAAIEWFEALGYAYVNGGDIAPDSMNPERADYGSVLLEGRLRSALARINPYLDADALDEGSIVGVDDIHNDEERLASE